MVTGDDATGGETKEMVAPLMVAGRTEGDGPSGATSHGVVMGFMGLDVGAKKEGDSEFCSQCP